MNRSGTMADDYPPTHSTPKTFDPPCTVACDLPIERRKLCADATTPVLRIPDEPHGDLSCFATCATFSQAPNIAQFSSRTIAVHDGPEDVAENPPCSRRPLPDDWNESKLTTDAFGRNSTAVPKRDARWLWRRSAVATYRTRRSK